MIMKQINNGFKECYYLKEDGTVIDANKEKVIKANKHMVSLQREDNSRKRVAIKTLYKEVYGKNYCVDHIEDLADEQWKEIEDTEGLYYVSNKGRIKSLKGYEAAILKPYKNQGGYARVDIVIEGKRQSKLVHRLVAAAFTPLPAKMDM